LNVKDGVAEFVGSDGGSSLRHEWILQGVRNVYSQSSWR
jgi:hypothetical protein